MSLLYFVLCSYGLTQLIAFAQIFNVIRPSHHFFHCPMCVGFWAGVFLMILNPHTELFIFEVSFVNAFLLGCLSSATSYALCMIISDGGIQVEQRARGHVDPKMDVKTRNKLLQG